MIKRFTLMAGLLVLSQWTHAFWNWKTYTSTLEIREMADSNGLLWCATEGGLLSFDPDKRELITWTNTEGLAAVDITAITSDAQGNLWIGMRNGMLQKYDPLNASWLTIDEFDQHPITCLAVKGDSLFIGLDIGVSLYIISRNEVKETYKHLGESAQAELEAMMLYIYDDTLWVITNEGLSYASLDAVNLLDPHFWSNESTQQGLPSNVLFSLNSYSGHLIAGTGSGVYRRTQTGWEFISGITASSIADIEVNEDKMYLLFNNRLNVWDGNSQTTLAENLINSSKLIQIGSDLFVGTGEGMLQISGDLITPIMPNCPGGNIFSDLAVDRDGALWCCGGNLNGSAGSGLYKFHQGQWVVYNRKTLPVLGSDNATSVTVDNENKKWIGTWGNGLIIISEDDTVAYRPGTGYFSGVDGNENYSVIRNVIFDMQNTPWVLNNQALSGNPVVAANPNSSWTYYGNNDRLTSIYVWDIAVDAFNRKWISTNWIGGTASGVFVLDDQYTPYDKNDDGNIGRLSTSDGLGSNNVPAIVVDHDNIVWIATTQGLFYYSNGDVKESYGLPSENIKSLLVDGANNLWVGTDAGVSYFSNEAYKWITFTDENSPLVSNEVIALTLNPENGDVYIGTSRGLSVVSTPFSAPLEDFEPLHIYPNPFQPEIHQQILIENLPEDVSVSIFTSNGYLVSHKEAAQVFGNTYIWNGKTDAGDSVVGGIYLVVVSKPGGSNRIGKFAVIR